MPMPRWRLSRRARVRSAAIARPGGSAMASGRRRGAGAARPSDPARAPRRARACREGGDRQARSVVYVERQALELGGGAGEVAEVLLADLAHAQGFRRDAGLLGEETRGERERGA